MAGPEVESFRDLVTVKMADPPWNYNQTMLSALRVSFEKNRRTKGDRDVEQKLNRKILFGKLEWREIKRVEERKVEERLRVPKNKMSIQSTVLSVRKRENERTRERIRERERERQTDRRTRKTQRDRQTRETERERERQTDRQTIETARERDRREMSIFC